MAGCGLALPSQRSQRTSGNGVVSGRSPRARKYQSHSVTIAAPCHRARSADMVGFDGRLAVRGEGTEQDGLGASVTGGRSSSWICGKWP